MRYLGIGVWEAGVAVNRLLRWVEGETALQWLGISPLHIPTQALAFAARRASPLLPELIQPPAEM